MKLGRMNNRGNSIAAVALLLAAVTITCTTFYNRAATGAQDASTDRGKYLADSTARSCIELAYSDAMESISTGKAPPATLSYASESFPAVRGRTLSCTAAITAGGGAKVLSISSVSRVKGSRDAFEAFFKRDFSP